MLNKRSKKQGNVAMTSFGIQKLILILISPKYFRLLYYFYFASFFFSRGKLGFACHVAVLPKLFSWIWWAREEKLMLFIMLVYKMSVQALTSPFEVAETT